MKDINPKPYLINFPKLGAPTEGYISVAEFETKIPFEVKRLFWTYYTPESIIRGRHAHFITEQILVAVSGRIIVTTQSADKKMESFLLDSPEKGIYIPPNYWHTMQYSHSAVQLVFASTVYNEKDYIRNFDDFINHYSK